MFVSGGAGPIPALALEARRTPIEDIEGLLLELPATTNGRVVVHLQRPDDFVELARRGFFAYDWSDVHRTRSEKLGNYELIAVPEAPLVRAALPPAIARLLEGLQLNVDFGQEALVDPSRQLRCRHPS